MGGFGAPGGVVGLCRGGFGVLTRPPYPLQLNGAVVQDVQLKVSIARKQPLLDAATGKSLWGSLGEYWRALEVTYGSQGPHNPPMG